MVKIMAKIKTFNKSNLGELRLALDVALAKLAETHGVVFDIGNIKFTENTFTTTLMGACTATTDDPYLQEVDIKNINQIKKFTNLRGVLLKTIIVRGAKFVVVGLKGTKTLLVKRENAQHGNIFCIPFEPYSSTCEVYKQIVSFN